MITTKTFKVMKKYHELYENENHLIYVLYQDMNGYIHYEYCDDPTKQTYTITPAELLKYKKFTA